MANKVETIDDRRTVTQVYNTTVHVIVTESGRVETTSGKGIHTIYPAYDSKVEVNGYVSAAEAAVSVFVGNLTVGANGSLSGKQGYFCPNTTTVTNHGTIFGVEEGIVGAENLTVLNDGTVQGNRYGIYYNTRAGTLNVTNEGTISGGVHAIDSGRSDDVVINKGVLKSSDPVTVSLGDGKDLYDSRQGGSAWGFIDLGGGNDTAYGGAANDSFQGGMGDDSLVGGGGFNFLDGGAGKDTLEGSSGTSLASYNTSTSGLTIHMAHEDQNTGDAAGDHFINIAGVLGSRFNDTIMGNDDGNDLRGGGADSLLGGEGADGLSGGIGDDTLEGGQDNDWFDGGAGADRIDGGDDWDVVSYLQTAKSGGGIVIDLMTNQNGGAAEGDRLSNIEVVQGTISNDVIRGFDRGNGNGVGLHGEAGNDQLVGRSGGDILVGGAGNDTLEGGGGSDVAKYSGSSSSYQLIRNADGSMTVTDKRPGQDGTDVLKAVSYAQFSDKTIDLTQIVYVPPPSDDGSSDDGSSGGGSYTPRPLTLIGTPGRDSLVGDEAGDLIKGLANNDTLRGNGGSDRLYGGLGNDRLTGGTGQDVFVFDKKLSKTNALNKKQNNDKITDFSVIDDTVWLAKGAFKALSKKGVLAKKEFHIGTKAHDGNDHVIYNKKSGALYYDADGTGAKEAIQVAALSRNLKMNEKDFFVL
ncbi:calcium-binding protein [Microvirga sp. 3-52]|uniref:calcium-binding protein n=1 Tax=Microvirga sp. 3-52 TaxID=2792425 RepID=UPI001AC59061|nr:calcium-binding protein [Microvirga sp. 3-52]MBO1907429.1 calcium-binding protein [Microvirga sp. 3-52]MBS7454339.1 calcium-binding protein [Microvirga sp. 3-52]